MTKSAKIIFFGNERLSSGFTPPGAPTLQALIESGYEVLGVVANYEQGTSRKSRTLEIEEVAKNHKIPLLLPDKIIDIKDRLTELKADIGVLVAYGQIIPQEIIDLFPHGIINIHPSLLPKYRGPTPIEQVILDGATETGVSIMKLVQVMDSGPIFAQTSLSLSGNEDKFELTERLLLLGRDLLIEQLPKILDGSARSTAQNEAQASYTNLLSKKDSQLDPAYTAMEFERQVRAFKGWPKSRLTLYGKQIIVTKAKVVNNKDSGLVLECRNNTLLAITELIAPSGRTMSGEAFLRGYKA